MNRLFQIILVFSLFVNFGCQQKKPVTKKEIINQRIEKKVLTWSNKMYDNCTDKVNKRAEAIVDSILIANAFIGKDTLNKPVRPEKPEIKRMNDTIDVVPLFERDTATTPVSQAKDTIINATKKTK